MTSEKANVKGGRYSIDFELAIPVAFIALAASLIYWGRTKFPDDARLQNGAQVVPIDDETKYAVRTILRDPEFAQRMIEQMRNPSFSEALINDPEVMRNLQKVADSMEQAVNKAGSGAVNDTSAPEKRSWSRKTERQERPNDLIP